MTQENLRDYTLRITQASQSELVVIMFDIILSDIEDAKEDYRMLRIDDYVKDLRHAQKFVQELMSVLDYSFSISYALMSLYVFVRKTLVAAEIGRRPEKLDHAVSVLEKLRTGFVGVSEQDKSGPVMQNAQQVYVGMTYGHGTLNESVIDASDYKRGFTA
ncbi:MAG: flagellar protein FliS [Lachnospiraceae bacterium]|nr:flagellar protein FliS [Lachnospiraceae bacterium]